MTQENYIQTAKNLKEEILKSRYSIAKVANRELLLLYYKVGNIISEKVASEKWGSKTIQKLSVDLQNELNGLRGFSYPNLKRMRQFHEEWQPYFNVDFTSTEIGSTLSSQFINSFISIGFASHIEIITKTKNIDARVFYITKCAQEFWSVRTRKQHLINKLLENEIVKNIKK